MAVSQLKQRAAEAALEYIEDHIIVGVGTGSTVHYFIQALGRIKARVEACVATSVATAVALKDQGFSVIDLNVADDVPIYVDGADEVNRQKQMIKGGGGALTQEKIVASAARQFVCIADSQKLVNELGVYPIAVEVIPMARSFVARELVKLGGNPVYRQGYLTDNGNVILDVLQLPVAQGEVLENAVNQIPGVVENGLFARRLADHVLVATGQGMVIL